MKNQIGNLLLAIALVLSVAAGSVQQSWRPSTVEVKSFRSMYGLEKDIAKYIRTMTNNGYVVKTVTMMDDNTYSKGVVVMEKY